MQNAFFDTKRPKTVFKFTVGSDIFDQTTVKMIAIVLLTHSKRGSRTEYCGK